LTLTFILHNNLIN